MTSGPTEDNNDRPIRIRPGPTVSGSITRRARLVFRRDPFPETVDDARAPAPTVPPQVEFIGYAEDCLLRGHVRMNADRLTDLLNEHDEYKLVDVLVEDLAGDRTIQIKDIEVARDELLLVQVVGPRGERGRRVRTRQHPLEMQVGPYQVRGYLHALPGTDPVSSFRHRRSMVPLTEASIDYRHGDAQQRRQVATVVVNRHRVDWVVEAQRPQAEMPDLFVQPAQGPLFKDFTGYVVGTPHQRDR